MVTEGFENLVVVRGCNNTIKFEGIGKIAALLNFFNISISYLILGATSLSPKIP